MQQLATTRPTYRLAAGRAAPPNRRSRRGRPPTNAAALARAASDEPARRAVLASLAAGLAVSLSRPTYAEEGGPEAAAGDAAGPPPATGDALLVAAPPSGELFEAPDFSLRVPAGFDLAETARQPSVATSARERGERGRGVAAPESPIKARFVSSATGAELSVLVQDATRIRPTFMQLSDIGQWGDAVTVAGLLLPRGTRLLASAVETVQLPPRDTGTMRGVVQPPPQTVYRYEFRASNGMHVAVAAAARAGRVYMTAGSAPDAAWDGVAASLRAAVESFRLATPKA